MADFSKAFDYVPHKGKATITTDMSGSAKQAFSGQDDAGTRPSRSPGYDDYPSAETEAGLVRFWHLDALGQPCSLLDQDGNPTLLTLPKGPAAREQVEVQAEWIVSALAFADRLWGAGRRV